MTDYSKITALYSRLSVGDEDRDGGESNSIQNQKMFLENYARGQHLTNIRHYIDDDESGRFFDRSAYSRMMDDVENGKIGVCIMKDLTRWGRDYLQVGNAMEIFRRNNVRFIAVNNGIDSEKPDTLEFAPFINIMSEWYAKDISKKVKTGIKTKGMSGKPIVTEAPYGYVKDPDNKDFWIIDEEAAEVVRLIFRLFLDGKNRNQIAVYLTQEQIPSPTFYMKDRGRGTCKNKTLNEDNRCKWNKATLTNILTRQEYCGDVVNFKTTKHFRDKHNHYVDRSQWHITENVHEPIISRSDFETVQRILKNAPVKRPNGDGEIHPLSGLLFCKDCGAKMHIRIDYRNGGKRHVAYCSEYHKGKAKNPKKSHYVSEDNWVIFENTQEPIIDQQTFDTVQKLRENVRRYPDGWGEHHVLTGLMYCADCGAKMYVHRTSNGKRIAQYTCSAYTKVPCGTLCKTQHRINESVVLELIGDTLRAIFEYAKYDRSEFIDTITMAQSTQEDAEVKKVRARIAVAGNRCEELEKLICRIYEDNILGKLPDSRYEVLDKQYAREKAELDAEIKELEAKLTEYEKSRNSAGKFIALIDKYEKFEELTPAMVNEFVDKVLVHERDRKGSIQTTQEIEIYFNFVGRYVPPAMMTEPTAEEQAEIDRINRIKDRRHQQYLRRKESGWQRKYEERVKNEKRAKMQAMKEEIRRQDRENGVYATAGSLALEPTIGMPE